MGRGPSTDPRQGALFDAGDAAAPQSGSLNFDTELRAALTAAIAGSGKDRAEVAADMEQLLGSDPDYPVSKALLDAWTAPSRTGHRFPAAYLVAFITATGAHWLLDRIARKCGRLVVSGEHAAAAELGMITAEEQRLKQRKKELQQQVLRRSNRT